ncbi:class I SAM-dependent methyltransferase [Sphingobacterium sp.]|uniref:class I SAM-dependent methyltransferase n=1 Tax=Sphingobacterium sp. TaxID=341027 RepID=UPI0028B237A6|nr:class I SAM-dependent methyltransferase [Sphingobacterium sp.]
MIDRITTYWDKQSAIWRQEKDEAWEKTETMHWLHFFQSFDKWSGQRGKRVLEIGTASGYFANIMVKAGLEVTTVDLSPAMIAEAREVSTRLGLRVDYHVMDAQALSFDANQFDLVFTRLMTWTIPDLWQCYDEILRVLKPGGMFINFDGDFGNTVFTQEGHEKYPAEIMAEANHIKAELEISKYNRPERDLYMLDKLGFVDSMTDLKEEYEVLSLIQQESKLFMLSAIKPGLSSF